MNRKHLLGGACALACISALPGVAMAQAQPAAAPEPPRREEVVIVTGSFIRGTSENTALPVNVVTAADLEKSGAPSTVEFIKLLSVSSGVQGDTNQFDARAQGNEGAGSVNLRGIGPERTLVLLNGRRMAYNPFGLVGTVVDTNLIPSAAIGRVEVLKDGAAAIYGSDAVAGVVNFITKTNLDGFEVAGDYTFIDGSDGNYTLSAAWGHEMDNARLFLSAGYQAKSELPATERAWAQRGYLGNPDGGWSAAGNPGAYAPVGPTGGLIGGLQRDPGCTPLGGFAGFSGTTPVCYWQFVPFDNLVEKETRYQIFGSVDIDINDNHTLHLEALFSSTETPEWKTSPSYAFLQTPTAQAGAVPGFYFVPSNNPGFQDFISKNPTFFPTSAIGAFIFAYRPYGIGGNPLFADNGRGSSEGERTFEGMRVSGGLKGSVTDKIDYDFALTYMYDDARRTGYDTLVNRFQLALRGLGGPNCNRAANTPGQNGCLWFNPFSNAIQQNAITGQTNPQYNATLAAQNAQVTDWFFTFLWTEQTTTTFVADLVFNGELDWKLGGGPVGWAAGTQYRENTFKSRYSEYSDLTLNPCIATPDFGVTNCANITGPTVFLSGSFPANLEGDVWAAFAEVKLPFTENFEAQLAGRYEDFGGNVGSTFNPKLAVRWQIAEPLAVRASVSTTFRAPSLGNIQPGSVTSLQSVLGVFRAVDIFGNPNLDPETATTYNAGLIWSGDHFRVSVDYWRFDFDNPIVGEPIAGLVSAMFPSAGVGNCGNAAFAAIEARFTFAGACNSANIARLRTQVINGSAVQTDGFDVAVDYTFENVFNGDLKIGLDATYTLQYKIDPLTIGGVQVAAGFDAVGLLNYQTTAYPLPQYKGTLYGLWENEQHSLRLAMNFKDSYIDQRTAQYAPSLNYSQVAGVPATIPQGKVIADTQTFDLNYRFAWSDTLSFTASVTNFTDEDPAFARLDLSYDPFTGNPLGRVWKIGIRKAFGG